MAQGNVNMPAGFGGLMRYKEEYDSKFKVSPAQIIIFIILIALLVIGLKIFLPVAG